MAKTCSMTRKEISQTVFGSAGESGRHKGRAWEMAKGEIHGKKEAGSEIFLSQIFLSKICFCAGAE
jgi:hypothetical protein